VPALSRIKSHIGVTRSECVLKGCEREESVAVFESRFRLFVNVCLLAQPRPASKV
jgi:hypothetical protein